LVALLVDVPQQELKRGDVGTVLEVFEANEHHPAGYLVEFLDEKAESWIELDITDSSQIVRLHFERLAA
jgi:hypothetical protein